MSVDADAIAAAAARGVRLHPGAVRHAWDHLVITLADADDRPTAVASLYVISVSPTVGRGCVAVLTLPGAEPATRLMSDAVDIGERMRSRLLGLGQGALAQAPVEAATFRRHAAREDALGWRITTEERTVELEWAGLSPGFWFEAPAPSLTQEEDIVATMVEARAATIRVDGVDVPGAPFRDEVWVPKLGFPLSSAHLALGELRLAPARGGA